MTEKGEEAHLRRWSQTVANICLACAFALPALIVVGFFVSKIDRPLWVYALGLIPVALLSMSLVAIYCCFTAFAKGNWFSEHPAQHLKISGLWLVGSSFAGIVVPNLIGALMADKSITFSLSSTQVLGLLFGTIIWNLGAVWQKAHLIAKENAEFV